MLCELGGTRLLVVHSRGGVDLTLTLVRVRVRVRVRLRLRG